MPGARNTRRASSAPGAKAVDLRARLEQWLLAIWYRGAKVPFYLVVLSKLYQGVSALNRSLYRSGLLRVAALPCPVVIVGNVCVGGGGKTPTVIALCQALQQHGIRVGILSRGYRRKDRSVRLVRDGDRACAVGDEPLLLHQSCGVPVAVGADRVAAARMLLAQHTVDLLISDDGLQHWRLPRALELVLLNGERRYGNGQLLPAGPLRERPDRYAGQHLGRDLRPAIARRLLSTGTAAAADAAFIPYRLSHGIRLRDGVQRPLSDWRGMEVHAVAGIADPGRYFDQLREAGLHVHAQPFPDHHHYTEQDLRDLPVDRPILCTDKDAVKLKPLLDTWNSAQTSNEAKAPAPEMWRIPLTAELPDAVLQDVLALLAKP